MANNKLNLPSIVPGEALITTAVEAKKEVVTTLATQLGQTQRARMETQAKVEVAKLGVAKEAIGAVKSLFEVLKSHNELQATRAEWDGRVAAAEAEVAKAEVNLSAQREKNATKLEELRQDQQVLERLLGLFDDVMGEVTHTQLSEEAKAESRKYLLDLSEKLVQLKR